MVDKFHKHTTMSILTGVVSTYLDTSYSSYSALTITALISGSTQIDRGKTNIVWNANEIIGNRYVNGSFTNTADVIKVVIPKDPVKVHSFPVTLADFGAHRCRRCGRDALC